SAARGHLARARIHRPAGERRRRRAAQRSADRAGHGGDRGGASKIRNHQPAADADHRQRGKDAAGVGRKRHRRRARAQYPRGAPLEGPYPSPEKRGVHARRHIRRPGQDDLAMLTAPRHGVLLATLAPEVVPPGFIAKLAAAGVRVSLGHSMATYEQTRAAMAEGLTGFTHLFNAMRPLSSRDPGPIAQALESPEAWYGLIVDGVHVDAAMLRLVLRGLGHPMLVTDAMPPVGGSNSPFKLHG